MGTPRAAIYTRVSTDLQAEKGTSLESQYEACEKKAEELGAEVVGHFEDAGESGASYRNRPALQRMLRAVEAGQVNAVICLSIDRLARDLEYLSAIRRRVETAGARLVFCEGNYEDTEEGELLFNVRGSVSQYERKQIRKRSARARRTLARKGIQPIRTRSPYGYTVVTTKHVIDRLFEKSQIGSYQVNEEQAETVKTIFHMYAGGATLRGITMYLQSEGIPTPHRGSYWRPSTVYRILKNPAYKGEALYGRQRTVRDESLLEQGFTRPFRQVPGSPENMIVIPAPRIVDPEVWERVNQMIQENRSLRGGRSDRKYMLTGLMKCPKCGHGMCGMTTRINKYGKTSQYFYYLCKHHSPSTNAAGLVCSKERYALERLERQVTKAITEALHRPELVQEALADWEKRQEEAFDRKEYDRLKAEVRDLEGKLKAVALAHVQAIQDNADPSTFRKLEKELSDRKKECERRIAILDDQRTAQRVDPAQVEQIISATLEQVSKVLQTPYLLPVEKHDALALVVEDMRPEGEGVRVNLKPTSQSVAYMSIFATDWTVEITAQSLGYAA